MVSVEPIECCNMIQALAKFNYNPGPEFINEVNYQGKKVNSGVFVYYFDGVLINGDPFYRKGNVTVIR